MVSRMPAPVSSMMRRSMPMPSPPIGGTPYSSASMKSVSSCIASGSPAAAFNDCAVSTSRWITGSGEGRYAIVRAAEAGDEIAVAAVKEYFELIAPVAGFGAAIVDPDIVVLDGVAKEELDTFRALREHQS